MPILTALLFAAAPAPVVNRLGFLSAGELADRCRDNSAANVSYCYAYVTAVYDTMRAYEVWLSQREFCVPATISQGELKDTFLKYIESHPGSRSGVAASGVAVALKESYACPVEPAPVPSPALPLPLPSLAPKKR